jgi:hypothetical protein
MRCAVTGDVQTCWYCGTFWLSPIALDAIAEDGTCLTCGYDIDHPRFDREACGVFRVEAAGEGSGLVLEALNEPALWLVGPEVGDPVGRRLETFADEPDRLLADARLALEGKGIVTRRIHHRLRGFAEPVEILIEHRALVPGRLVIAAWLVPAVGADGLPPQVSSSAA